MTPDADLLVIGGGPVGLAVAIEGRLAGLSVIVVEPRATPVDKACSTVRRTPRPGDDTKRWSAVRSPRRYRIPVSV